jgi:hypothetical protein
MTSRPILALALLSSAGCFEETPTLEVTTTALVTVELAPPDIRIPDTLGHYRWELTEAPPLGYTGSPPDPTPTILVTPHIRGIYKYDRWFVGEAADQLTYHVVLTANGSPPRARIVSPPMVTVGSATTLDGSSSTSPEQRVLTFSWRLAVQPASSTTALSNTEAPILTFVPDVAGDYGLELRVFDGELWSEPALATLAAR